MRQRQIPIKTIGFIILFILAHFSHHLLTALVIPMLPLIRDSFNLNYAAAGLVSSAFTFFYGIGQMPAGWAADRFGPRIVLVVGVAGVALAGAMVGSSISLLWLVCFLMLMGVAGGGYHPAAPPLIIGAVGPLNRGRALGFHVIGGSLSHFIAPVVGIALASLWGWRGAFLATSLPVFLFGVLFFVLLGEIGRRAKATAAGDVATHSLDETEEAEQVSSRGRLISFLVLTCLATSFVHAALTFIPLIMIDHFGTSEKVAALTLSLVYSAGFWAAPLGGYLSDRLGRVPVLIGVSLLLIPVMLLVTVLPYSIFTYLLMVGFGLVLFLRMPVSEAFIIETVTRRRRSTILGLYFAAGMMGGGILTPLIGLGVDRFGFRAAFIGSALVYTLPAVISILVLMGISRRQQPAVKNGG